MERSPLTEVIKCYHCGNECEDKRIGIDDKYFCCEGCKSVYEILNNNDLCSFYDLNDHPGLTQKVHIWRDRFAFLDQPEIVRELIKFTDGTKTHAHFYVPQMHCSSCLWLLENIHKLDPGIEYSRVNFTEKEIFIVYRNEETSLRKIVELLTTIGYEPHLELGKAKFANKPETNKTRIVKIGIAGFSFANIMMLSLPEYFSGGKLVETDLGYLFTTLIFILSLPVLFYCSTEFFTSAWKGLKAKFINIDLPIVLAILITFGRSIYEIQSGLGNGYLDSMSGIVFFMLIGRFVQDRSYRALSFDRSYKSFFPIAVQLIRDGKEVSTPIEQIRVQDRMVIHNQEIVPVDGLIEKGQAKLDYSFVSGESEPVYAKSGELIYAGARQTGASLVVRVLKPVSQSYLTSLWNRDVFQSDKNLKVRTIDSLGQYFSLVVLILAAGAAWYWHREGRTDLMWNALTTILIVACPCALLLASSYTNANLIKILARNKLYLKHADVLERIAGIRHIVFDKTGTLTRNVDQKICYSGEGLDEDQKRRIQAVARQSTHPLSQALVDYWPYDNSLEVVDFKQTEGKGIEAWVDEHYIKMGSASFLAVEEDDQAGGSAIYVREDGRNLGCFHIEQSYREGLDLVFRSLEKQYDLSVISGDRDRERPFLSRLLGEGRDLFFQFSPVQKLDYVRQLQAKDEKVMMIGDGLNDAGALQQSEVGIAVTENKNNFTPACDGILDGASFRKIPAIIDFVKDGRKVILLIFVYSFLYNVIGGYFALKGVLEPVIAAILMPASSLSIILLSYCLTEFSALRRKLNTDDENHPVE